MHPCASEPLWLGTSVCLKLVFHCDAFSHSPPIYGCIQAPACWVYRRRARFWGELHRTTLHASARKHSTATPSQAQHTTPHSRWVLGTLACVLFGLCSWYSGTLLSRVRNRFYPAAGPLPQAKEERKGQAALQFRRSAASGLIRPLRSPVALPRLLLSSAFAAENFADLALETGGPCFGRFTRIAILTQWWAASTTSTCTAAAATNPQHTYNHHHTPPPHTIAATTTAPSPSPVCASGHAICRTI